MGQAVTKFNFKKSTLQKTLETYENSQSREIEEEKKDTILCPSDHLMKYSQIFADALNKELLKFRWNPSKDEDNCFKCTSRLISYLISNNGILTTF